MPSPTIVAKPPLPLLKTPRSAGSFLPSELPRSPRPGGLDIVKQEEQDIRTPITPPTAYTDFLKALSPAVSTPLTTTSLRSSFSFSDKTGHLTPISQPSSAGSNCSCKSQTHTQTTLMPQSAGLNSNEPKIRTTVLSAPLCPPTPFMRLTPARTPSARSPTTLKKLRIPQSPSTASISECSSSATPKSATPKSTTAASIPVRSPFSPTSWYIDGKTKAFGLPVSASPRHVSVKQVVTRTVTYRATALEPAPRGKRRKLNDETAAH